MPTTTRFRSGFFLTLALPLLPGGAAVVEPAPPTPQRQQKLAELGSLRQQALTLLGQGKSPEGLAAAEKALAISREVYGNNHDRTADALDVMAVLHEDRDDLPAARKVSEDGLAIRRKLHDDKHWRVRSARLGLAYLDRLAGLPLPVRARVAEARRLGLKASDCLERREYYDGVDQAGRAIAVYKEVLGEDHFLYGEGLGLLAVLQQHLPDRAKAEQLFQQAAKILEQALGEQHPTFARCLSNQGQFYQARWDFPRAEALLQRASSICEQALGKDDPQYALSLDNLGVLNSAQGKPAAAECLYNRSLAIYEQTGATVEPGYATVLTNLGALCQDRGDYARSERLYNEALKSVERTGREKSLEAARIVQQLGNLHLLLADPVQATRELRRVAELLRTVLGEQHPDYASSLLDLAFLYVGQKRDAETFKLLQNVLAIYTEVMRREQMPADIDSLYIRVLHGYNGYAATLDRTSAPAAEWRRQVDGTYVPLLKAGLDMWGAKHPTYGRSLVEMADAYFLIGNYAAAERRYQEATDVLRPTLGDQHPDFLNAATGLARVQSLRGDYRQAGPALKARAERSYRRLELSAAIQSERQQLVTTRSLRADLDFYLTLAVRARLPGDEVYQQVMGWKGAVFASQRRVRLERAHPELAGLLEELRDVAVGLVTLSLAPPASGEAGQYQSWRQRLEELTRRKEQLEQERARQQPTFAREDSLQQLTTAQLRALLPADTALIDFFEYTPYSPPLGVGVPPAEPYLAAFVVRRDARVALIDLGRSKPVTDALRTWRRDWVKVEKGLDDPENPAIELRRLVWRPLQEAVKGARTVLVSPDGALNRLPFGALPGSRERFLLQEVSLAVVPVPQLLPELLAGDTKPAEGRTNTAADTVSLFLVGNIDYRADPGPAPASLAAGDRIPRGNKIVTLPNEDRIGRGEMTALRECFLATHRRPVVTLREDDQATENEVCKLAPGHRYLHFATHGYFAPAQFKSALDAESPDAAAPAPLEARDNYFSSEGVTGYHPGLLSGLMLAGALSEPRPEQSEGIVTALEVAELDLRGVELAVLSACQTGLGREAGGEGVLGLQRAFQMAGARATVAGLWKVHSQATEELMTEFYLNLWQKKLTKLEALRQAQLTLMGKDPWRAPYYWAPFVLSGDWH